MWKKILLILLMSSPSFAADEKWYCEAYERESEELCKVFGGGEDIFEAQDNAELACESLCGPGSCDVGECVVLGEVKDE